MARQLRSKEFRNYRPRYRRKLRPEPDLRFYSLWDKVCRADVLEEAFRAGRRNDGAPGCDGMTFDQVAAHGQDRWLEELRQELRAGDYRPQPLLRVWTSGYHRTSSAPAAGGKDLQPDAVVPRRFCAFALWSDIERRCEFDGRQRVRF
jgi:hypothetical protein